MDETTLLAYVDGELTVEDRQEAAALIAASPEAAACVARLEASRLPYKEVFASQKLPPVPQSLVLRIEEMARQHARTRDADTHTAPPPNASTASANDSAQPADTRETRRDTHRDTRPAIRSRLRVAPGWLAVAFVAGAFCLGGVLRFAPIGAAPAAGPVASPWVEAATGYQQLFSRTTVADAQPDPETLNRTVGAIRSEDGLPLRVPDLRSAGLAFRQVQRLQFHGRPLVQLVYLPNQGDPVALCVMKQPGPDQSIAQQTVNGMKVVTWRQGELGYALIGPAGPAAGRTDLPAIGKRIAERGVDQLFGESALPGPRQFEG